MFKHKIKNKKILAIIPARGGSKGLPRKNVKFLAGKPLIVWTIQAALGSKYLNRIIVSTEDKQIAEISKKFGVEILNRPKYLATDTAKTIDVVLHVLKVLEKKQYIPDILVLLQPTSPLRQTSDIDKALEIFLKNKNKCESVISVCKLEPFLYWSLKLVGNYLKPFFNKKLFLKRRQDLPKIFFPNGAIYITTPKIIKKYKSFYPPKIMPYFMPKEKSIDIDNLVEFKLVELILKSKFNF